MTAKSLRSQPAASQRVHIIAVILESPVIEPMLTHGGLHARAPGGFPFCFCLRGVLRWLRRVVCTREKGSRVVLLTLVDLCPHGRGAQPTKGEQMADDNQPGQPRLMRRVLKRLKLLEVPVRIMHILVVMFKGWPW